jgi:tripartite-type tricarboxylate transporter receptor subunit TctC
MHLPRRSLLAASAAALAAPRIAHASLPQGLVRVLVGFPPGGGTDVMGRIIAEALRKRGALKNMVIENRAGASGTVACEALKYATPDGTTLLFAPSASTVQPVLTFRKLPFDPRTDFAPITMTRSAAASAAPRWARRRISSACNSAAPSGWSWSRSAIAVRRR